MLLDVTLLMAVTEFGRTVCLHHGAKRRNWEVLSRGWYPFSKFSFSQHRITHCSYTVETNTFILKGLNPEAWRENTNKMQQSRCLLSNSYVYYQLLSQHVSSIIMPIIRRTKTVYYCVWCLRWMWLVAVVGRCVVGCGHCEVYCSKTNLHSALQRKTPQPLPATSSTTSTNTICSNTRSSFSWWWE